jgi:hypothetical protein
MIDRSLPGNLRQKGTFEHEDHVVFFSELLELKKQNGNRYRSDARIQQTQPQWLSAGATFAELSRQSE